MARFTCPCRRLTLRTTLDGSTAVTWPKDDWFIFTVSSSNSDISAATDAAESPRIEVKTSLPLHVTASDKRPTTAVPPPRNRPPAATARTNRPSSGKVGSGANRAWICTRALKTSQ